MEGIINSLKLYYVYVYINLHNYNRLFCTDLKKVCQVHAISLTILKDSYRLLTLEAYLRMTIVIGHIVFHVDS